ncbi:MAG: hypothetical protein MUE70_12665 [Desulfobacterales bacterium]|jgi:hypothetical protein|nr:hypothetical protein [Desulfobacterales bacterium]
MMTENKSTAILNASRSDALNPWLKLAIGIALVLIFIFCVGKMSLLIPGAQRMAEVVRDHDLRPAAIFYTDFEASADSSEYVRHSLSYPPKNIRQNFQAINNREDYR